MIEAEQSIQDLYKAYKAVESKSKPKSKKFGALRKGITRSIRKQPENEDFEMQTEKLNAAFKIVDMIRRTPATYPLSGIVYEQSFVDAVPGFFYGFDFPLGDDVFSIEFFSRNDHGLLVQKQKEDKGPEIEIIEHTVKSDTVGSGAEEVIFRKQDVQLLLPEGFSIPVGPLHFEEDSLPMSRGDFEEKLGQAIYVAKELGLKLNKQVIQDKFSFLSEMRQYPDRFFYWQPPLSEKPVRVAIDFDAFKPVNMGLSHETAPVFTDTIFVNDQE